MRNKYTILLAMLALVSTLLLSAVLPTTASAHTAFWPQFGAPRTFAAQPRVQAPFVSVTYLKRGAWGNYYFSPTYTSVRVFAPFVIVNQTGRNVILTDNTNPVGVLRAGGVYRTVFYSSGAYQFNDAQSNIGVSLYVYAYWR